MGGGGGNGLGDGEAVESPVGEVNTGELLYVIDVEVAGEAGVTDVVLLSCGVVPFNNS